MPITFGDALIDPICPECGAEDSMVEVDHDEAEQMYFAGDINRDSLDELDSSEFICTECGCTTS